MSKIYKTSIMLFLSVFAIGAFCAPGVAADIKTRRNTKPVAMRPNAVKAARQPKPVQEELPAIERPSEEYGVSFVSSDTSAPVAEPAPKKVKKAAAADIAFPSADVTVDDELMASRTGRITYRYNICALGSDLRFVNITEKGKDPERDANAPKKQMIGTREVRCKLYYGGGDAASKRQMVNAAIKDFNFYFGVKEVRIMDAKPVHETPVTRFDISKMKGIKADFDSPDGTIFKKIIVNRDKIKTLSSYSYVPLALKINELSAAREDGRMPQRITVYEQYTPRGVRGTAVIVFNQAERFLFDLPDLERGAEIYDILPDYALQYVPKTQEELSAGA